MRAFIVFAATTMTCGLSLADEAWTVDKSTDKIDRSAVVVAVRSASEGAFRGTAASFALVLRCKGREVDAILRTDEFLGQARRGAPATLRIGETVTKTTVHGAQDYKAIFFSEADAHRIVAAAIAKQEIAVRAEIMGATLEALVTPADDVSGPQAVLDECKAKPKRQ